MKNLIVIAALMLVAAAPATSETTMNADGLKAVEAHWSQAFLGGDAAYLQSLLTDDYVSVNASGVARDKATIIKLAQMIASKPHPAMAPQNLTYAVAGNTGIVTSDSGGQRSVDVFYYTGGQWHAWYSQHTTIAT